MLLEQNCQSGNNQLNQNYRSDLQEVHEVDPMSQHKYFGWDAGDMQGDAMLAGELWYEG